MPTDLYLVMFTKTQHIFSKTGLCLSQDSSHNYDSKLVPLIVHYIIIVCKTDQNTYFSDKQVHLDKNNYKIPVIQLRNNF